MALPALRLSRRALLGLSGAGAVGAAAGAGGLLTTQAISAGSGQVHDFHGEHQAGILTPVQEHLHFAVFDVGDIDRSGLAELLADWTVAAERMTSGEEIGAHGAVAGDPLAPPEDTGEALGLPASGLTITVGFGAGLFRTADGADRFGLAGSMPEELEPLPDFAIDQFEENATGGDLCIQACADDPQVAVHAIRNLSRIAFGRATLRWSQLGYGRTSTTSRDQQTPRNLFGFKDGTAGIKAEDASDLRDWVWAGAASSQSWMRGGSYLVVRKIRMIIESWDRVGLAEQERVIGRTKGEGAPLGGEREHDEPDFAALSSGRPVIDVASHVRLAHPAQNSGIRLLRRGYNYVSGNDALGRLDAGLLFICFQADHRRGFTPIQKNLRTDAMGEYLRHVGSGLFAVPPGVRPGERFGEVLFG